MHVSIYLKIFHFKNYKPTIHIVSHYGSLGLLPCLHVILQNKADNIVNSTGDIYR